MNIIEWHNTMSELPKESGYYLIVYSSTGRIGTQWFNSELGAWMSNGTSKAVRPVTYWAEMPEIPKSISEQSIQDLRAEVARLQAENMRLRTRT